MSTSYKTREWTEFRAEVIELDNGACRRCGRSPQKDGVILQVHHTVYHPGKPLWQYAYAECLTLCKGCHAEEHGHVMPKTGWDLVYQDDLGDLVGTCEKCGTSIRHVFYIDHPKWESLTVGTFCCDSLTNTDEASEFMKRNDKRNDRLKTFLASPKWNEKDDGHHIKRAHMCFRLGLEEGGYRIHVQERRGKELYPTLHDAKVKIFDLLDDGTAMKTLLDLGIELEKPMRKGKRKNLNSTKEMLVTQQSEIVAIQAPPNEVAEAASEHGVQEAESDRSTPNDRVERAVDLLRGYFRLGSTALSPRDEDPLVHLHRSDFPVLNKRLDLNGAKASKRIAKLFVAPEGLRFLEYICDHSRIDLDVNGLVWEGHSMLVSIVMNYPRHDEFENRLALLFLKGYKLTDSDKVFLRELFDKNKQRLREKNKLLLERWGYATIYSSLRITDTVDGMQNSEFLRAVLSLKTRTVLYRQYNTLAEVTLHVLRYKEGMTGLFKSALRKYGLYERVCNEDRTGEVRALMEQFRGGREDEESDLDYLRSTHLGTVFPELMPVEDPTAHQYID